MARPPGWLSSHPRAASGLAKNVCCVHTSASTRAASVSWAASIEAAIWVVAALTATSGAVVAARMYETHIQG